MKTNRINWVDTHKLTPMDYEIQRHLDKLDQVAIDFESRWGIGRLEKLAPYDLAKKWNAQQMKLRSAIMNRNETEVAALVTGTIKGWGVLEGAATEQGEKPIDPEYWEIELDSGFKMRVTRNNSQASALHKSENKGIVIFTLSELARLVEARYKDVFDCKKEFPEAQVTEISFEEGDKLPI